MLENKSSLQNIQLANQRFLTKERQLFLKNQELLQINNNNKAIVFISVFIRNQRAKVFHHVSNKSYMDAYEKSINYLEKWIIKNKVFISGLKLDFVENVTPITMENLLIKIKKTRKNYFRYGISFTDDFSQSFLEQEVNGNAFIRENINGNLTLDENNIRHYLKVNSYKVFNFNLRRYFEKEIYLFQTKGFFIDFNEGRKWLPLQSELNYNGIRKGQRLDIEIKKIIRKSTEFLTNQVKDNGEFHYGYFSAFDKSINTYNILRHSSSLYSMLEGYEISRDRQTLIKSKLSLDYLLNFNYVEKTNNKAFIVDKENDFEIKLGSNATAILAISKYTEITGNQEYLEYARNLANGMIDMYDSEKEIWNHVLKYPNFKIKESFRIIYYEGEAIFSLLRLYELDPDEKWLNFVVDYFEIMIKKSYWKYHDHWLSYAVNELTKYLPEEKYFIFGLKNCKDKLNFIYKRETTFPTFLELTMAAYQMIKRIKKLNLNYLLEDLDELFLEDVIDFRADYQRTGFMYPEVAMYFKNPAKILNGFYIRHHSFRVRIDDVEHNLSGYIQYLNHRIPDKEVR